MAGGKVTTQLVIEGKNNSKKAFDEADSQLKKLTSTAKAAGAVLAGAISAAAITEWVRTSIDAIDMTGELAERVGMAAGEFAGLQYAAKFASIEGEALAATLTKFNQNVVKAAEGGKAQAAAFDSIGVSIRNADGSVKGSSQLLLEVADRFAQLPDGAQKSALAIELFGKQGAKLLPLLNKGSAGIRGLIKQAEDLGLVLDEASYKAAGDFNDSMDVLAATSEGAGQKVAANLVPALNDITGLLLDFSKNSRSAAESANFLGTGLKLLTTVGVVVAAVFKATGDQLGAMAAVVAAVARGDFGEAADIAKQSFGDTVETAEQAGERLKKLWNGEFGQEAQIEQNKQLAASFDVTVSGMGKSADSAMAHMEEMKGIQKQLVKDAQESLKAQVTAQNKANAELEKSKQAQVETTKRYQDALAKLEAGVSGDPSFGQAQALKVQARQAQQAGNVEEAKTKAQAALAVIQELQEAGANTYGFEGFVRELQAIEQAADQIRVDKAQASVDQTTASVRTLKAEIDKVKDTQITINLPPDQVSAITSQFEALAQRIGKMMVITPTIALPQPGELDSGGYAFVPNLPKPPAFAGGGHVRGPGSGTSDSIMARLSNGEFVMQAAAVRKYGVQMLDLINQGVWAPGFASGGLVDAAMATPGTSPGRDLGRVTLSLPDGGSLNLLADREGFDAVLHMQSLKRGRTRR